MTWWSDDAVAEEGQGPGAPHVDVAIVGAGFAGLGAAMALRAAGREDFVVLERAETVGGTWRDNTYPGVACDIPSHLYSYAEHPNPGWSRRFAPGDEIRDYLERTAAGEGVLDRVVPGAELLDARWDAAADCWRLATTRGPWTAGARTSSRRTSGRWTCGARTCGAPRCWGRTCAAWTSTWPT